MSDRQSSRSAVIAISSHVVRGCVGNRAVVFALESLGHAVWSLPTVILPWHPGHGHSTRMVVDGSTFHAMTDDLANASWLDEVGAIITGYLGSESQARAIAELVRSTRARNPDMIYLCDPVIGDQGGLYVPPSVAGAIRDCLLPLCDIATPNRFELSWLAGVPLADGKAVIDAAMSLGPDRVLVTSVQGMTKNAMGNLLVSPRQVLSAEHRVIADAPNGPGDLLGAVFLSRLMQGDDDEEALRRTTAGVFEVLSRTAERGTDELTLEQDVESLRRPNVLVDMRHSAQPANRAKPDPGPFDDTRAPLVGVDGCRAGWVAVIRRAGRMDEVIVCPDFRSLILTLPDDAVIAVDMPIGLPERIGPGGRGPESLARRQLGARQSSVFSIPSRSAVYASDYGEACRLALETSDPPKKVSKQAYHMFPKIRDLDRMLRADATLAGRIFESHPEMAFWRLNGKRPMALPKKIRNRINPAGMQERQAVLEQFGFARGFFEQPLPRGVGQDDLLYAAVLVLMAGRLARAQARPLPDSPPRDAYGLPIAFWT